MPLALTVSDSEAPTVLAAGLQAALVNGTRTIEAAGIDYGSYDAWGRIASLTLSKTTVTCANVGPNDVTLTMRDKAGSVATQTVTVLVTADALKLAPLPPLRRRGCGCRWATRSALILLLMGYLAQ